MNLGTYLVTDDDRSGSHSTVDVVEAAIAGGVDIVQLREKGRSARDRYELGPELRAVTREAGVPLIVNDRVDLARAVEADGVHLGDDDVPVAVARECLDDDAIGIDGRGRARSGRCRRGLPRRRRYLRHDVEGYGTRRVPDRARPRARHRGSGGDAVRRHRWRHARERR